MKCPVRGLEPCDDECAWLVRVYVRDASTRGDAKVKACALAVTIMGANRMRGDIPNCERVLSEQQDAGAENGVTES